MLFVIDYDSEKFFGHLEFLEGHGRHPADPLATEISKSYSDHEPTWIFFFREFKCRDHRVGLP